MATKLLVKRKSTKTPAAAFSCPEIITARPMPASVRERILLAAVEILNTEGFSALTQTRVAERAGVRQSHITYYFPVRNDLLRETAMYGCNAMLEEMSKSIDSGILTSHNFSDFFATDINDRRFARLMCALIVASDEDVLIKPWLAIFEEVNRERLLKSFHKLGLNLSRTDVECFHATFVGALVLDLGDSTEASRIRTQCIVRRAFNLMMASIKPSPKIKTSRKTQK